MSKTILTMVFACLFVLLTGVSCTIDDKADEALPRLQVSQARYEVALPGTMKDGSVPEIRVIANKGYQITSSQPWLKVDKAEGSGLTDVQILCDSNLTGAVREGDLTVTSHDLRETIHVTQTLYDPSTIVEPRTFYQENFDWTLPIAEANGLKDPVGGEDGYTRMSVTDAKVLDTWKASGLADWYLTAVNPSGANKISIQKGYLHFNANSHFNTGVILPALQGTTGGSETVDATLSFQMCPDGSGPDNVPAVVEIVAGPGSFAADKDQPTSEAFALIYGHQWKEFSFHLYGITSNTRIAIHTTAPDTQKYCRWFLDNLSLKEIK